MKKFNTQSGIGLVEVLVSLLLLAIAVLGFTSLQLRSVQATDESLKRTQAMSVIRGLSEDLRVNVDAADTFRQVVNDNREATNIATKSVEITDEVSDGVTISKEITIDSCNEFEQEPCTNVHIAARDALQALLEAEQLEVQLGMGVCPGTEVQNNTGGGGGGPVMGGAAGSDIEQNCIIASWDETEAVFEDNNDNACATAAGIYNINARCIIVGAY